MNREELEVYIEVEYETRDGLFLETPCPFGMGTNVGSCKCTGFRPELATFLDNCYDPCKYFKHRTEDSIVCKVDTNLLNEHQQEAGEE